MVVFTEILKYLSRYLLVSPLCVWGKLPGHGDFLKHRCSAAQARDWQAWVSCVWRLRLVSVGVPQSRDSRVGKSAWVNLEPRRALADLVSVPIAFVMQPGVMRFARRRYVQGVMVDSEDSLGRVCPLIIYQQVSPGWMRRIWDSVAEPKTFGHATENRDLLYWLARLAACMQGAGKQWGEITQAVDAVWALHRPTWRNLWGAAANKANQAQLDSLLNQYCSGDRVDIAKGLRGVPHLPWANWPGRIFHPESASQLFWQQDVHGGYVNASEDLLSLWGVRT